MKIKNILALATLAFTLQSFGAPRTTAASSGTSDMKIGAGFSTFGGTAPTNSSNAASVILGFGGIHNLQFNLAFASSSPFNFGTALLYRATVHGTNEGGFHVGGGMQLGTTGAASAFTFSLFPLGGFHFGLGGLASNVTLAFDMGPVFTITPAFQFMLGSFSGFGGASLHYWF